MKQGPFCIRTLPAGFVVVLAMAALLAGCTPSASTQRTERAVSEVVGTWTYRASGAQPLSRGTLQLSTTRGHLTGRLRDAELGSIPINARLHGERLTLRMDLFRVGPVAVSGTIEGNEFRGIVDRPTYDVTMNQADDRYARSPVRGAFHAERRTPTAAADLPFDCPRLGPDGLMPCR